MVRDDLYNRLYQHLSGMPVIDTHEHLPPRESLRDNKSDVLSEYTSHYISSDLVSAGLSLEELAFVRDTQHPLEKRWRIAEPYWQACRFTGYARALDLSVRAIYQIDGIQRHTLVPLNEAFIKARKPGHYRHVIRDLCHITCCVTDSFNEELTADEPQVDSSLIRRVWQPIDYYYECPPINQLDEKAEKRFGRAVLDLDQLICLLASDLELIAGKEIQILKITAPYFRSLHFPVTPYAEARQAMDHFLVKARKKPTEKHVYPEAVQNFMMHEILKRADRCQMTVQIHTGLQEGNGNYLSRSNPLLLTDILLKYPDARFDLFHLGYPFIGETIALAKNFANVSVDMCWSHIIAPSAARRALSELIDAVPATKISAFGGDYLFVDGLYGHLQMAKENVADVLAEKVRDKIMDEDQAYVLARHLFYDNPKRLLQLT